MAARNLSATTTATFPTLKTLDNSGVAQRPSATGNTSITADLSASAGFCVLSRVFRFYLTCGGDGLGRLDAPREQR